MKTEWELESGVPRLGVGDVLNLKPRPQKVRQPLFPQQGLGAGRLLLTKSILPVVHWEMPEGQHHARRRFFREEEKARL